MRKLLAFRDGQAPWIIEDVRLDDSSSCSALRPENPDAQLGRGGIKLSICSNGDLIRLMMVKDDCDRGSSFGIILVVSATLDDGVLEDDNS